MAVATRLTPRQKRAVLLATEWVERALDRGAGALWLSRKQTALLRALAEPAASLSVTGRWAPIIVQTIFAETTISGRVAKHYFRVTVMPSGAGHLVVGR